MQFIGHLSSTDDEVVELIQIVAGRRVLYTVVLLEFFSPEQRAALVTKGDVVFNCLVQKEKEDVHNS